MAEAGREGSVTYMDLARAAVTLGILALIAAIVIAFSRCRSVSRRKRVERMGKVIGFESPQKRRGGGNQSGGLRKAA